MEMSLRSVGGRIRLDSQRTNDSNNQLGGKCKLLSFLYGAFLTRVIKVRRSADGLRVDAAEVADCGKHTERIRHLADLYHDASTINHIWSSALFVLLKAYSLASPEQSIEAINQYLGCWTPRYVLGVYTNQSNGLILGALLSGLQVMYRLIVRGCLKELDIDVVTFLLGDEQEFHRCLRESHKQRDEGHEQEQEFTLSQAKQNDQLNIIKGDSTENPLMDCMYYRYRDPITLRVELRLRPNRDVAARQSLFSMISLVFCIFCPVGLLVSLAYLITSLASLLIYQEDLYVGCDQQWNSFSYLARNFVVSVIVLFNSLDHFIGLIFSTLASPILIYDLDVYLGQLKLRINKLKWDISSFHVCSDLMLHRNLAAPDDNWRHRVPNYYWNEILAFRGASAQIDGHAKRKFQRKQNKKRDQICRDVADLQASLVDFFALLQRTDRFISWLIPFSILVWLLCNGFLTLSGIQLENSFNSTAIRVFQVLGFILSGLISCSVLQFKRRVELAYVPLCTLMAMDPDLDKTSWIPVMSFFTYKPRYAFTLFGSKIYTRLAYLSYISYTFTFVLYVEMARQI